MIDHDTDSYEKISRAFVDGCPRAISPGTGSSRTSGGLADGHRGFGSPGVLGDRTSSCIWAVSSRLLPPVGFTTFPGEIWPAPRSWVEKVYPSLTYFNEVDRGGHFAAWEEPELFATEIRAAFRPLR